MNLVVSIIFKFASGLIALKLLNPIFFLIVSEQPFEQQDFFA